MAAKTENGLWVVTAKSIHDVARERGTDKKTALQRRQHREERKIFAATATIRKRQAFRTPQGEIVDLQTGHVLIEPDRLMPKNVRRWDDRRLRLAEKGFPIFENDTFKEPADAREGQQTEGSRS